MTDHFDGRRYFNPNGANGPSLWMVPRMLETFALLTWVLLASSNDLVT